MDQRFRTEIGIWSFKNFYNKKMIWLNFKNYQIWVETLFTLRRHTGGISLLIITINRKRIIINELCLPLEHKSVKPKEVGGIAGGTKYIAQGILFKLVVDEVRTHGHYNKLTTQRKLYHGDHWAMKAASAELKGVMSYGNCKIPNLVTPLMAIIDYR
jgi:hypothetical protein